MDKIELYIIEKAEYCELLREWNKPIEKGDCEKVFYKAMAEAQKQPTEILFINQLDGVKKRMFVPEQLHQEEIAKRDKVIRVIGTFLKEVAGVPQEVYNLYFTYSNIDDLYDHLINLLGETQWPEYPFQEQMKFERGNEVGKRDNIVFLTGEYLRYNMIYTDFLYAPFFKYPVTVGLEGLFFELSSLIHAVNPGFKLKSIDDE